MISQSMQKVVIGFAWICLCFMPMIAQAENNGDLKQVVQRGVLRHLGVVYANFVTGSGDGFSVDLMQQFAKYLGVEYEYVPTAWSDVIPDLIGKDITVVGDEVQVIGSRQIEGDVIANGLTILSWRDKVINYSEPIFPTQVWMVAKADAAIEPIVPSGEDAKDIALVKNRIDGLTILGIDGTCLDTSLYSLKAHGASTRSFEGSMNELVPAIMNNVADATVLDVPDALIALQKWGGEIKVIGPVSHQQNMGCGFRQSSPQLLQEFNDFLRQIKEDGTYLEIVNKYYPNVFDYYPDFFDSDPE
ncbi:MAG: transporter substrate-binding domain-containing protein [Desulfovermiculus sp.]|nr:transporter substrate-binding domain-containing protein [Desulfovermiculus sp.]